MCDSCLLHFLCCSFDHHHSTNLFAIIWRKKGSVDFGGVALLDGRGRWCRKCGLQGLAKVWARPSLNEWRRGFWLVVVACWLVARWFVAHWLGYNVDVAQKAARGQINVPIRLLPKFEASHDISSLCQLLARKMQRGIFFCPSRSCFLDP